MKDEKVVDQSITWPRIHKRNKENWQNSQQDYPKYRGKTNILEKLRHMRYLIRENNPK